MTLAAQNPINSYVGTGGSNTYSFAFPVFSSSDITVTVTSPTGTVYTLTFATDYTVSGLNPAGAPPTTGSIILVNSGQLWLTSGNLTTGWTLTITRIVALAQSTSFRNQGDFYPEMHEAAFDYLMMAIQQLQQAISAPVIPINYNFPGDITVLAGGAGLIVTDSVTGIKYRITVQNGIMGIQPLP